MQLFYSQNIQENQIQFDGQELQHLRVLRYSIGQTMHVIDGNGNLYTANLDSISKKLAVANIIDVQKFKEEKKNKLHIAIAPTKNMDRIEFFLEKVVELGIQEISFIRTTQSERKHLKAERMQKIMVSACKQSKCYHFPTLHFDVTLQEVVEQTDAQHKWIAHCIESKEKEKLNKVPEGKTIVLIGPEGDFTSEEVSLAMAHDFKPLDLGESRLRTETAGIYVAAAFRHMLSA